MVKFFDYSIFREFTDKYLAAGFQNIRREDPFMLSMEEKLAHNRQFFYVADLLRIKILFTSNGSQKLFGIEPEAFDISTFISRTHPDEMKRYGLARVKLIKLGQDVFMNPKENLIISTTSKKDNGTGDFINVLFQGYIFYSEIPHKTVFLILVMTDLTRFQISEKGHHYYVGNNLNLFRYPDAELLKIGNEFSAREFEILMLIAEGMDSENIARKLCLSVNTVNTHRRNILKKSNKQTTHDLVIELQERGVL